MHTPALDFSHWFHILSKFPTKGISKQLWVLSCTLNRYGQKYLCLLYVYKCSLLSRIDSSAIRPMSSLFWASHCRNLWYLAIFLTLWSAACTADSFVLFADSVTFPVLPRETDLAMGASSFDRDAVSSHGGRRGTCSRSESAHLSPSLSPLCLSLSCFSWK